MLLTITIIISCLVIINLFVLKFSLTKTTKTNKVDKNPIVLKSHKVLIDHNEDLAPTGS